MSSGCVLRKINQLFTCEKRCDSVEARKALLEEFASKVYRAEVVYVGSDGNIASEERYNMSFILSGNQKDHTLNTIYGSALHQNEGDGLKQLVWTGTYLAKKGGYKMRVSGDNIEKDFYVYCGGNDKINFLIKKTVPEDLPVSRSKGAEWYAVGSMRGESNCEFCQNKCSECNSGIYGDGRSCNEEFSNCLRVYKVSGPCFSMCSGGEILG